jgi:hypothetical protein
VTLFSAQAVLGFKEVGVERIAEVAVVLLLGMMLPVARTSFRGLWFSLMPSPREQRWRTETGDVLGRQHSVRDTTPTDSSLV